MVISYSFIYETIEQRSFIPCVMRFFWGVLDLFAALSIMVFDVSAGSGELGGVTVFFRELRRSTACVWKD